MRILKDFKRKGILRFFLFPLTFSLLLPYPSFSGEKVQYLKKVGEIKDGFSSERENFFIKITGLCCDDEGNLYVADSGWNKIFKFDSNGKFLMSFGREGQGPGEFMAGMYINLLGISFGNDGKLYIKDRGNNRISVFTKEGKFIKSYPISPFSVYDPPVVNSKGDIFLHSKSGIKVIDCYDSNFKYRYSLLDIVEHREEPFDSKFAGRTGNLSSGEVLSIITRDDRVILISNVSLTVWIFRGEERVKKFKIREGGFLEDLRKMIEKMRKEEPEIQKRLKEHDKKLRRFGIGTRSRGMSLYPFSYVFFDNRSSMYLLYYVYFEKKSKILKFDLEGNFIAKSEYAGLISPVTGNENFIFGVDSRETVKIIIFKSF
jgi:hypothetical protein